MNNDLKQAETVDSKQLTELLRQYSRVTQTTGRCAEPFSDIVSFINTHTDHAVAAITDKAHNGLKGLKMQPDGQFTSDSQRQMYKALVEIHGPVFQVVGDSIRNDHGDFLSPCGRGFNPDEMGQINAGTYVAPQQHAQAALSVTDEMVEAAENIGDLYRLGQPEIIRRAIKAALEVAFINASHQPAPAPEAPAECGACHGSGWMVRDADIGTEQECSSCDSSGQSEEDAAPAQPEVKP